MKKIIFLIIALFALNSCGSLKDTGKILRNEKITNTDEFLIKKQEPLILPPDYNEIPTPGSLSKKNQSDNSKIKKILKSPQEKSINNKSQSSSVEDRIINRIRK